MTVTRIIAGLLALALAAALAVAVRRRSRRRPVAGGRGPARFTRENQPPLPFGAPPRRGGPPAALKTAALLVLAVVLVAWVAVAAVNRAANPPDSAGSQTAASGTASASSDPSPGAAASPAAPAAPLLVPSLSGSLAPPPDPSAEPPAPPETPAPPQTAASTVEPEGTSAAGAAAPPALPASAEAGFIMRPGDLLAGVQPSFPSPAASAPLGTFAPTRDPEDLPGPPIRESAIAMAPGVSRMEPVGRLLAPEKEKPPPRLNPATSEPPRPRLTDPPLTVPSVPTEPPRRSDQPVQWTVHLGSFGKPESAEAIKEKLLAAGLPGTVVRVTVNNKVWFRVMSGAFDDHESAAAHGREIQQLRIGSETPYVRRL